jgi:hypothetical protein
VARGAFVGGVRVAAVVGTAATAGGDVRSGVVDTG